MTQNISIALFSAAAMIAAATTHAQESSAPPVVGNVTVSGSELMEDKPDGVYGEPEWVKQRRFRFRSGRPGCFVSRYRFLRVPGFFSGSPNIEKDSARLRAGAFGCDLAIGAFGRVVIA